MDLLLPKVTLIIPYNIDRGFLSQAIDSALNQDYTGSIELITEKSNQSVGYNINQAIKKAQGKYIKYFAEDDFLTPDCVRLCVDHLEATGSKWMHANSNIYFEAEKRIRGIHIPHFNPTMLQLLYFNYIHGGTVMYHREIFNQFSFDESLWTGEEYDFYLQLYKANILPTYLDATIFNYRRHPLQKSLGNLEASYQAARKQVVDQIRNRYR